MAELHTLEVRYFAAAAEAAGTSKETLQLPAPARVSDVVAAVADRHGQAMARILGAAAFLVDDELTRDRTRAVDARVDVLPPFAGG